MNAAPHYIRVHACTADVFANAVDDQQVDIIEGQFWHKLRRFGEELRFARFDLPREQSLNARGFWRCEERPSASSA